MFWLVFSDTTHSPDSWLYDYVSRKERQMKPSYAILIVVGLTGCANTVVKVPNSEVKEIPQQDLAQLVVLDSKKSDKRHQKEQVSEQETYEKSLLNIDRIMSEEVLTYAVCVKDSGKNINECNAMMKSMCEIDMILDSRGGHHMKNYCSK